MDKNWIHIMVILVIKITSGAGREAQIKDGHAAEIKCKPSESGSLVIWFRVLDNSGMEFIASYTNTGIDRTASPSFRSTFSSSKITSNILTLKSFNKTKDTGSYSCAALVGGRELAFGDVTRLVPEKKEVQQTTQTPTKQTLCSTVSPCVCEEGNKPGKRGVTGRTPGGKSESSLFCTPIILGPLVGGCGLLLLLLIITTVYCNKVRTRRCPHHYKRKPRTTPGGKQMQPGRYV